jgi:hypothetical protein
MKAVPISSQLLSFFQIASDAFCKQYPIQINPMKTLHIILAAYAILSCAFTGTAQSINCDSFTVIGLEPDTFDLNNTLIQIEMSGGVADFANYPYIPSITDCNGDTVATGGMFFFGQIGGTEQGYPVSAISDDVCLPLTIEFIYNNDLFETDTCLLTFEGNSPCNLFAVTGIEPDTLNPANTLINIEMAGDPFDQVNYPFVIAVTDCNGDSMAAGEMVFFGQLGQTTQGYPVSALGNDVCFPITVEFFFGTTNQSFPDGTTCLLTFDGHGLSVPDVKADQFSIFPNPAYSEIQLSYNQSITGKAYGVFNTTGGVVLSGTLSDTNARIDLSALPEGVYIVMVDGSAKRVVKE